MLLIARRLTRTMIDSVRLNPTNLAYWVSSDANLNIFLCFIFHDMLHNELPLIEYMVHHTTIGSSRI